MTSAELKVKESSRFRLPTTSSRTTLYLIGADFIRTLCSTTLVPTRVGSKMYSPEPFSFLVESDVTDEAVPEGLNG
jgi:hypothetical protein